MKTRSKKDKADSMRQHEVFKIRSITLTQNIQSVCLLMTADLSIRLNFLWSDKDN